jgi:uncharacterized membrane protein
MNNELKTMLQSVIQEALQPIQDEIAEMKANMATKQDVEEIKQKLDTIYVQVAHNTEQEVKLNEVALKVKDLDADVRLLKRIVTN